MYLNQAESVWSNHPGRGIVIPSSVTELKLLSPLECKAVYYWSGDYDNGTAPHMR